MKKKLIAVCAAFAAVCLFFAVSPPLRAESGSCGPDLRWRVENGTLTVTGTGEMDSFYKSSWYFADYNITKAVLAEGVTSVGDSAFVGCTELTSISLPSTLTSIGSRAFTDCSSLETIAIPAKVAQIGDDVRVSKTSATTSMFYYRGVNAFLGCDRLAEFIVAGENPYYASDDEGVLYNKKKTELLCVPPACAGAFSIPATVRSVGCYALICNGLTDLMVPNSVRYIEINSIGSGLTDLWYYGTKNQWYDVAINNPDGYYNYDAIFAPITLHIIDEGCFDDVFADEYYAPAVSWAVAGGVTNGTSKTTFSPAKTCTRAQVVTFLWRAFGKKGTAGNTAFRDVDPKAYYAPAVSWAVANNITNGTDRTHFSPDSPCTRGQVVTFLYRAAGSPAVRGESGFGDVSADDYFSAAVTWAVANHITNGTSKTTFSPEKPCTRGQVVTFLYRFSAR